MYGEATVPVRACPWVHYETNERSGCLPPAHVDSSLGMEIGFDRRLQHLRHVSSDTQKTFMVASGFAGGRRRDRLWTSFCLALGAPTSWAWPSDLLKDDCAKGRLLVEGGLTPPPIMGAIPELDLSILRLRVLSVDAETDEDDDSVTGAREYDGRDLIPGEALELIYENPRQKPLGVHLAFVASSGAIAGAHACGTDGTVLHCSTCGDTHTWLRRVVWRPTREGPVTLAVGAARANYGTPAVHVAVVNVTVGPGESGGAQECTQERQPPAPR